MSDWHTVADYRGPFEYAGGETGPSWSQLDPPDWLFEEGWKGDAISSIRGV